MSGSVTLRRRDGKATRASPTSEREISVRIALSPAIEPPSRKRDATTRSLFVASRLRAQRRDRRRRVLQVGIHDAHPGSARGRDPCDDCAAETAVTLARLAVDERDLEPCRGAALGDDGGGRVVRVVDDDELGAHARECLVEAVDEGADDRLLVASRRDDRQLRSARRRDRTRSRPRAAQPLRPCPAARISHVVPRSSLPRGRAPSHLVVELAVPHVTTRPPLGGRRSAATARLTAAARVGTRSFSSMLCT